MQVAGHCPMGCPDGLILAEDGTVWCGHLLCPRPTAAAEILADAETGHIVIFETDGYTIRHPLRERLDDALLACELHGFLAAMGHPLHPPGRYRAAELPSTGLNGLLWAWERLAT